MRFFLRKHVLFFLPLLAALCLFVCVTASAAQSGTCGDSLTWTLDDEGLLTVSGTGPITDWPWPDNQITAVKIESGVTGIADAVFSHVNRLKTVTLPDTLTFIGKMCFSGCNHLSSIDFGKGLVSIDDEAFKDCTSLEGIIFPDSLSKIGNNAFEYCTSLTSVSIPAGVQSVGVFAFAECTSMTDLTFNAEMDDVNFARIFCNTPITAVNIPGEHPYYCVEDQIVYNKEHSCVVYCPQGRQGAVRIPDGITDIGDYACENCTLLTSVTIPDSVTNIGKFAFGECTSLTSLDLPDAVTQIGDSAFRGSSGLTSLTIPEKVTKIGSYICCDCTSLKTLTLHSGITYISYDAFKACPLTEVTLYGKIEYIGVYAFDNTVTIRAPRNSYAAEWAEKNGNPLILFDEEYTVTVTTDGNGTASADFALGVTGTVVTLTAVPEAGYQLKEWQVISGGVTVENNQFTIGTEDVSIQAIFEPERIDIALAKINTIKDQVYTGKALKPAVTVKYSGKKLKQNKDYTVNYKNNKAVGTATITVKGKGRYTGTAKISFKINPKPVALTSLKAGIQQLTVTWGKGNGITGYEIQYSLKSSFKKAKTITITKARTTSRIIRNLKKNTTYYVRIRTYKTVKGTKYYSAWSKSLKQKVNP